MHIAEPAVKSFFCEVCEQTAVNPVAMGMDTVVLVERRVHRSERVGIVLVVASRGDYEELPRRRRLRRDCSLRGDILL